MINPVSLLGQLCPTSWDSIQFRLIPLRLVWTQSLPVMCKVQEFVCLHTDFQWFLNPGLGSFLSHLCILITCERLRAPCRSSQLPSEPLSSLRLGLTNPSPPVCQPQNPPLRRTACLFGPPLHKVGLDCLQAYHISILVCSKLPSLPPFLSSFHPPSILPPLYCILLCFYFLSGFYTQIAYWPITINFYIISYIFICS